MIVGLTGKKHSGKSSAALLLQHRDFIRIGFSDPIKQMLRVLELGDAELTGHLKELPSPLLLGQTSRWAQQSLGMWGREQIDPRLWVGHWDRKACAVLDHGGNVVADDIREEIEANAVRRLGGVVIRIVRPGYALPHDAHPTENQEFKADITITNNSTVAALHRALAAHLFEG